MQFRFPSATAGDYMGTEQRSHPADTQEFVALWNAAKEEHFVQELAVLLPRLLGSADSLDSAQLTAAARHIVDALHLASTAEGGVAAGMDYLSKVAERPDVRG
jgi:hypothetical protein